MLDKVITMCRYGLQATQKVSPVWLVSTVTNVSGPEHWVNIPSLASWKTHPEYQQDAFVKQGCPQKKQSPNMANNPVLYFDPAPTPGACDVSEE